MQCVTCKKPMLAIEHKEIELDYCPACEGVWLDSGELELLMESFRIANPAQVIEEKLKPAKDCPEKPRPCPVCRKKMEKMNFGDSEVLTDHCVNGEGIWFDKGELEKILNLHLDQAQEVLSVFIDESLNKH